MSIDLHGILCHNSLFVHCGQQNKPGTSVLVPNLRLHLLGGVRGPEQQWEASEPLNV